MSLLLLVIGVVSIVRISTTQNALVGERWNEITKNFEPIPGRSTFKEVRQRIVVETRAQETHNFNGESLNVTYFEDLGFFHYLDNDTRVSGICGDIWTILSHFLNFTLVLSKSEESSVGAVFKNLSFSGILKLAGLNQTDIVPKTVVFWTRLGAFEFTTPLWINRQRIFASGQWKRNPAWMFDILAIEVWIYILITIIILSIASIVTQRILILRGERNLKRENYLNHVFYTFSTMCNQGVLSDKTGSGSRLLNLTITFFCFVTLIAFNSRLITIMTEESFEPPFNDLQTLMNNTDFNLVVLNGSTSHLTILSPWVIKIFGVIRESQRYTVVTNVDDLYEKVCNYPDKYVMLDSEESVAVRGNRECIVVPVGIPYYATPISSGITRRVKNRRALDLGIMKLREYGILNVLKERYMKSPNPESNFRRTDSLTTDMSRVMVVFSIFCSGVVASIIICIGENVIFTLKKRNIFGPVSKRIYVMRKRTFPKLILYNRRRT